MTGRILIIAALLLTPMLSACTGGRTTSPSEAVPEWEVGTISLQAVVFEDKDNGDYDLDGAIRRQASRQLREMGYRVLLEQEPGIYGGLKEAPLEPGREPDAYLTITVVDLMVEHETSPYLFDIEAEGLLVAVGSGTELWRGSGRGHREDGPFGFPRLIYEDNEMLLAIRSMVDWLFDDLPAAGNRR